MVFSRFVSVDYFRTLGVQVARGRDFSARIVRTRQPWPS